MRITGTFFSVAAFAVFGSLSTPAQDTFFDYPFQEGKWHPTIQTDFKAGSRHIGQLGFTMPLKQDESSLFFFDFRGWVDDDHNDEIQAGLAYRQILGDKLIGFYGFFDRHHTQSTRNQFDQVTLGAELLGPCWDHRFNAYLPTDMGGAATGTGQLAIAGNRLLVSGLEERAYWGVDYEIGKLLGSFGANDNELRLYAGGFYFNNDAPGFESIAGPRMRLEMRLFDVSLLGAASRVTVSGEVTWDEVRETRGFAGLQVQIPLGNRGRGRTGEYAPFGPNTAYAGLSRMERRMYDPILRDVDIVTNTSGPELANDAEDDALFVANSGNGIDTQIANAGRNGTVIVDGTIRTPGSHQLLNGQRIAGGNSVQTVTGATTGRTFTGALPGRRGTLQGTNPGNPVIILADNTIVDSLFLQGGNTGIFGSAVSNVTLVNNTISNMTQDGIGIAGAFGGLIDNNLLFDNSDNGLFVGVNNGTISNNMTRNNADDGIDIGGNNNGIISGNTSTGDGDESIEVKGDNRGMISHNTSIFAGDNGIQVGGTNFGSVIGNFVTLADDDGFDFDDNRGTISGNTATFNGDDGIDIDGTNFGLVSNNTASGNAIDGFSIFRNDASGRILSNTANGNGFDGFFIVTENAGVIRGNSASRNLEDGFDILVNSGTLSGNTATGNLEDGFDILVNSGTLSGNTATGNSFDGFFIALNAPVGDIMNNTSTGNLSGFNIDENRGDFTGNVATNNTTFGFGFAPPIDQIFNYGVFDNNTASNNLGAGFRVANQGGPATYNGNVSINNGLADDVTP